MKSIELKKGGTSYPGQKAKGQENGRRLSKARNYSDTRLGARAQTTTAPHKTIEQGKKKPLKKTCDKTSNCHVKKTRKN